MRGRCANHAAQSPASGPSATPAIAWRHVTDLAISPSSPTIDRDGTLYFSADTGLRALLPDGTEKWTTPIPSITGAPAIGRDGTLFAASTSMNGLRAIDPSGTVLWTLDTGPYRSPALGADGTLYTVSYSTLVALNASGDIIWEVPDLGTLDAEPAVAPDGTVYVANAFPANRVYAFTPTGEKKWDTDTGGGVLEPPLVSADGTVHVSTTAGIAAFSADGTPKWTHPGIRYAALAADGTLYGGQNQLFAIDPNGSERWAVTTYFSRAPVVDAAGNVYVMSGTAASSNGTLTSYDSTGAVRWTLQTPFGEHQAPVMGADGTIYVATSNMFEGRGDGGLLMAIH
jgi:sugar lactone lactonase YvrE